jgi:uncharacterized membrane protein YhaH (DUF805 family)
MKWYFKALRNYAVFEGRAHRKEYWMFYGWNLLFSFVPALIDASIDAAAGRSGPPIFLTLYTLGLLIPSTAIGVRRMHDTNHRGWWLLVPIISFVYLVIDGTRGANDYGEDPKAPAVAQPAVSGRFATANVQLR